MRGLYAIIDVTTLSARAISPVEFAAAVLVARPAALQLRAKGVAAREVLGLLRALGPLCHRANVPLIANDRADLAALAGCDMVHVGQDDIGIDLVRRLAPSLGVGISTLHTLSPTRDRHWRRSRATTRSVRFFRRIQKTHRRRSSASTSSAPLVGPHFRRTCRSWPSVAWPTVERAAEVATACDAAAVIAALLPDGPFEARAVSARAIELHRILSREHPPAAVGA